MPCMPIQIPERARCGRTSALLRDVTGSLVRVLGKRPEYVRSERQDIDETSRGIGGLPAGYWKLTWRTQP